MVASTRPLPVRVRLILEVNVPIRPRPRVTAVRLDRVSCPPSPLVIIRGCSSDYESQHSHLEGDGVTAGTNRIILKGIMQIALTG